jgi:hypothetical protein
MVFPDSKDWDCIVPEMQPKRDNSLCFIAAFVAALSLPIAANFC